MDPAGLTKRAKGSAKVSPRQSLPKPSSFFLTTSVFASAPLPACLSLSSPVKPVSSRRTLAPKSPVAKRTTAAAALPKSSPIVAPAGRSPTQGKRSLLSSRRRTGGPTTSSAFGVGSSKSVSSLDAALRGTISKSAPRFGKAKGRLSQALDLGLKASLSFEIREDSPAELSEIMLEHCTNTLDISSDEENEFKADRDRAEGCDKENVPPPGDMSQQVRRGSRSGSPDNMDAERVALAPLNARDYYAIGCDETSVVLVDEDEETEVEDNSVLAGWEFAPRLKAPAPELEPENLDDLVANSTEVPAVAAVLQPLDGAEESFELWESGSAQDEAEATV